MSLAAKWVVSFGGIVDDGDDDGGDNGVAAISGSVRRCDVAAGVDFLASTKRAH